MKKFLITGGAGFIGSYLTEALLAQGNAVTVADNFSTGSRENLAAVEGNPSLRIVELDITRDGNMLDELVAECDVLIHLAAAVGVEMVVNDPIHTLSTNVKGTENVLGPAAKYKKRTIVASTSEVYGKSDNDTFTETVDLHLGSPYRSRWSYACSKLLDEFYVMAYCQNEGLPGTIVRFFNTVGPRQTGRYGMVVPRFAQAALNGEPVKVYGDGEQSRCFCHVKDVVRALMLLIDRPEAIGNIYNIGSQELVTISELAQRVIARSGSSSTLEYIPYEKAYAKGFEDMRRRRPNTSALSALTGWKVEHTLNDILDDVLASLKK
ncbi:MAG: GDP-mannose 4,6-dehydratase [Lentisphaeria bacterium]|nr:GDP-mannose 4,6-dehydratase [Lentisphaeria bacterium]